MKAKLSILFLAAGAFTSSFCSGQSFHVSDQTSPPSPGSGHDYIQALGETVNPRGGSLNLNFALPLPNGRQLSIPLGVTYNSNGAYFVITANGAGPGATWGAQNQYLGKGGWSYTAPLLSNARLTVDAVPPGSQTAETCEFQQNYIFHDPTGSQHELGMRMVTDNAIVCNVSGTGTGSQGGR